MINCLRRKLLSGLSLARMLVVKKKNTDALFSETSHGGESPGARAFTVSLQSDIDRQEETNRSNKKLLK